MGCQAAKQTLQTAFQFRRCHLRTFGIWYEKQDIFWIHSLVWHFKTLSQRYGNLFKLTDRARIPPISYSNLATPWYKSMIPFTEEKKEKNIGLVGEKNPTDWTNCKTVICFVQSTRQLLQSAELLVRLVFLILD